MYDTVKLSDKEKHWIGEFFGVFLCRKSDEFMSVLRGCVGLEGNGLDDFGTLSFANEYEENYEGYFGETGVCISIDAYMVDQKEDLDVIISNEDFYKILEEECGRFYEKYPDRRQEAEALLVQIKEKLLG